jgi:uncharacterized membrane protein YkgB
MVSAITGSGVRHGRIAHYGVVRASMVLIFYIFGYAKWHAYDVPLLTPLIRTGPLIFWLIPTFGAQGAVWFLGASEWTLGTLLLLGFWNKKLGLLGAIGSTGTFLCTVTILPFLPGAWEPSVGFPALTLNSGFLMKDFVLLAVSIYLMRQDAVRVARRSSAGAALLADLNTSNQTR